MITIMTRAAARCRSMASILDYEPALPPVPLMVLMLASGTAGRCRSMVSLLDYDLRCRPCRS